jgi:hypothetical protein
LSDRQTSSGYQPSPGIAHQVPEGVSCLYDGVVCWKVALVDFEYANAFDSFKPSTYSSGQQFFFAEGTEIHHMFDFDERVQHWGGALQSCESDHVQVIFLDRLVVVLIGRRRLVHRLPFNYATSFAGFFCVQETMCSSAS